ncbi:MAG: ABC transporter permease [Acidobacteria bacterium]|nr:ABC transporter permease [Acidobacteriota bacterium]
MSHLRELWRRIGYFRNRERLERELAEEMQFHADQKASRAGRVQFGNTTLHREDARAVWIPRLLDETGTDIRYALRGLAKSPGFAAIAIGTLALGIGAGTAIFSLAEAVLVRPLPYPDAASLLLIYEGHETQRRPRGDTSPGTYRALRDDMRTVENLAVFGATERNLTGDGEPERVSAGVASANFFQTVGVQPLLGRLLLSGDDELGRNNVVVLTHALWQRRYAGDPKIIGREIRLGEELYTVIGVLPERFVFLNDRHVLWLPLALPPERWAHRDSRYVFAVGRMRAGVTLDQVQSELAGLAQRYRAEHPVAHAHLKMQAVPAHERLAESSRTAMQFLLAAVVALLLIACSNVANLLLARSVARESELAVRAALGAGRGRLVRQLLTEALVLAIASGLCGLGIAYGAFQLLQPLVPGGMAVFTRLEINGHVVGIMLALAVFSTVVSGLLPSLRAARPVTSREIGGRWHETARGALVVTEVALAILLLTGAGLLFRTFSNLRNVDPGFQPRGLLSAQIGVDPRLIRDPVRRTQLYNETLERVKAIPGVQNATFATAIPSTWKGGISSFTPEGQPFQPNFSIAMVRLSTPGYFETLGLRLRAGRWLTADDHAGGQPVVVINRALAERIWKGENPVGKRLQRGNGQSDRPWVTVVGVVEDVYEMGLNASPYPITYFPESQQPEATFAAPMTVVLRTVDDPARYANSLRHAIWQANAGQVISKLLTVEEILAEETAELRIHAAISGSFALLALLLACLGIYGVLAYVVTQRRREFGVRLALGATQAQVVGLVAWRGVRLALMGISIGAAASLLLGRYLETLLFQVKPNDPLTLAGVAGALLITAFVACLVPARRAMHIDPGQALRYY